jgi:hypothetical protein
VHRPRPTAAKGGRRAGRALLAAVLAAPACLDDLLEAPYVLATGLPPANGLSPSGRGPLLVATDGGTFQVDGEGRATLFLPGSARAVGAHRDRVYALETDRLAVYGWPVEGGPAVPVRSWPLPGALDLQSWCGESVLVAFPDRVERVEPESGTRVVLAGGLAGVRGVGLGAPPCERAWVATAAGLVELGVEGPLRRVELPDARAVAVDDRGRTWALHGAPPVLSVLAPSGPTEIAGHLGDARDLHFGTGGLLPPDNVYLASGEGGVDYARLEVP